MDFYEEIKHSLYSQKTIIGRTHFEWKDFIEAKHNEAPYKGKAFYQTLAKTMAITGMKIADKEKGEVPTYQELVFLEVWEYCKQQIEKIEKPQTETKIDKLKVPQIALIHIYEGKQITEENAKEIAANYGYTAKTSGKGLYHDYLKYCKTSDRKAKPTAETKKTLINKIELFKSIVNYLSEKAKLKANDEINILNTILENEYQ
jgi:hypothetical protein